MGSRLQLLRRTGLAAAGAIILGSAGCALPNGVTGGDPILGNFNRPIVPTPPPERGGLGLDSPAYDAGARIGVAAPDLAAPTEGTGGGMSLPPITNPGLMSGARLPFGGSADEPYLPQRPMAGARLPSPHVAPTHKSPAFGRTSPDAFPVRPRELEYSVPGGLVFVPPEPTSPVRPAGHEVLLDPTKVKTMDDSQALLRAAGARGQKTEQLADGDWCFACTVGIRSYESRGNAPLEAMKIVLEQIQKDR